MDSFWKRLSHGTSKAHPKRITFRNFKHEPLDHSKRAIRLLKIGRPDPNADGNPESLSCHIQNYDLKWFDMVTAEGPSGHFLPRSFTYTALSYTWGPETPTHRILLNGMAISIRENLFQCLMAFMRCGYTEKNLWIDQLCIDQNNTVERNAQVQMMGTIYSEADQVFVWLGCPPPGIDANLAFKSFRQGLSDAVLYLQNHPDKPQNTYFMRDNIFRDRSELEMQGLISLLTQPYWTRLWIVQEIYLAQKLVLWYGNSTHTESPEIVFPGVLELMSHDLTSHLKHFCEPPRNEAANTVRDAFRLLLEHRERMVEQERTDTLNSVLSSKERWFRTQHAKRRVIPLDEAISLAVERQCTDVRDKIYGLQACIDPNQQVNVDYDMTPEQVFWRVVRRFRACQLPADERSRVAYQLRLLQKHMGLEQMPEYQLETLIYAGSEEREKEDHGRRRTSTTVTVSDLPRS